MTFQQFLEALPENVEVTMRRDPGDVVTLRVGDYFRNWTLSASASNVGGLFPLFVDYLRRYHGKAAT